MKGWGVVVLLVMLALCGMTAWLWHISKGLEARVLEAIQPHLLTDIGVGSVELTVWSSWPDVEVVLYDVRIEDAVERGRPFVEMEQVGVVFSSWSLLGGEWEVRKVNLEGGHLTLHRTRTGQENWRFWRSEGASSDLEWNVERVQLKGVMLKGRWFTEGETTPVQWSAFCEKGEFGMPGHALSGQRKEGWRGRLEATSAVLDAGGTQWLDKVGLDVDFALERKGESWEIRLPSAHLSRGRNGLTLDAAFALGDELSLELVAQDQEAQGVMALLPEALGAELRGQGGWSGKVNFEAVVGETPPGVGWLRFASEAARGAWGVRVSPEHLGFAMDGVTVEWDEGSAEFVPTVDGWRVMGRGLAGKAAGGEFRGDVDWWRQGEDDHFDLKGEFVARPAACFSLLGGKALLPRGCVLEDGGSLRADGRVRLDYGSDAGWTWNGGRVAVVVADLGWSFSGEGGAKGWRLKRFAGEGEPSDWKLELSGLDGPGIKGGGSLAGGQRKERWTADVDLSGVELEVLLASGVTFPERSFEGSAGLQTPVDWQCDVEELRWNQITVRELAVGGQYLPEEGAGSYDVERAEFCEGRITGEGQWNARTVEFRGRLSDASVSELLTETRGLGQELLLPRHVRGRLWSDGVLAYYFDRDDHDRWKADLDLSVESGELLDFEWLQEIPEVLKEQPKYRLLADSEDLKRRLRRIRFEPMNTHVTLDRGLFSLNPTEVVSDAMNVGIEGWQQLSGAVNYTLDFALRDLKSNQSEFGLTADDGLGHRFFLSIGGTLDEPVFGYDRNAHKAHRKEERQEAVGKLRSLIFGNEAEQEPDSMRVDTLKVKPADVPNGSAKKGGFEDDEDDF
jgi:hypothetical protein